MDKLPPTDSAIPQRNDSSAHSEAALAHSEATYLEVRALWWRLYSELDCLINPPKRRAMLSARLDYQEAKRDWLFRLRSSDCHKKLYSDVLSLNRLLTFKGF